LVSISGVLSMIIVWEHGRYILDET
jgi:hypothetical protein